MSDYSMKRAPDARRYFGVGNTTFYEWIRAGLMTPGILIGGRSKAWPTRELNAIAAARIASKSDDDIRQLVRKLVAARSQADQSVA